MRKTIRPYFNLVSFFQTLPQSLTFQRHAGAAGPLFSANSANNYTPDFRLSNLHCLHWICTVILRECPPWHFQIKVLEVHNSRRNPNQNPKSKALSRIVQHVGSVGELQFQGSEFSGYSKISHGYLPGSPGLLSSHTPFPPKSGVLATIT